MLRLAIVLPIVLGLSLGLPLTAPYQAFAAWLARFTIDIWMHLAGYVLAAITAGLLIWRMEAAWIPRLAYSQWLGTIATLRAGLIGVLVMAGMQLFFFFTQGQFDVLPLFAPAIFLLAEAVYETVEGLRQRHLRLKYEREAVAAEAQANRSGERIGRYFE